MHQNIPNRRYIRLLNYKKNIELIGNLGQKP